MISSPDNEQMRERYARLLDTHGQLRLRNSFLEERILNLVDVGTQEKTQLEEELIAAKQQIFRLEEMVHELQIDKQRYKDDCNLAVQLLQQYPNEFPSTPDRVESHSLLMPTFPPTFLASIPSFTTPSHHRLPSVEYLCSNCRRTVKCADVSVQANPRLRLDEKPMESSPSVGYTRRISQEKGPSSCAIPGMHDV